jgi:hypothetical protein
MKKKYNHDYKIIIVILGVIAALMILLPVLILKDSETSFTGLEVAFGHEFASLGSWASGEIAFNPFVLLAFALPLVSSLVLMFTKKGYLLSTILFIAAIVFIFLIPEFTKVTVTVLENVNEIDVNWTYGLGLILVASLSILGALLGLFKLSRNA